MEFIETILQGCVLIKPKVYEDERGLFFESFRKKELEKAIGYTVTFVQDNQSVSKKRTLRGLHYQEGSASQAKLVRVIKGEVLDVVVDLREKSDTYGQHMKIKLDDREKTLLFIPKGMAHGFLTLSDETIFSYKCDNYYEPNAERGIIYNDETLNINWGLPEKDMILSKKDLRLPKFAM